MIIPEKYRERYDRLARSHPWMREMRDETRTVGDLISQRTEKIEERNHLIAEARNSFKSLADREDFDLQRLRRLCRKATEIMDSRMERMGIAVDGRAIEALDEPTNEIGDEITLPEGDAVTILRSAAKEKLSLGCLILDSDADDTSDAFAKLADMVERDYVRRDDFNKMRERHWKERVYWQNEMHAVLDTLNGKERFWGACMEYPLDEYSLSPSEIAKQTLERNYVRRDVVEGNSEWIANLKCSEWMEKAHKLERERDEWKAKAETIGDSVAQSSVTQKEGESLSELSGKLSDSREELEAEIRNIVHCIGIYTRQKLLQNDFNYNTLDGYVPLLSELLDRQAAITANETSHGNPYVGLVRGKQWERKESSDYYCGKCGWKVTDHDSYCPECGGALHRAPNQPTSQSDVSKSEETVENDTSKDDIRNFDDSREKLEEDVADMAGAEPLYATIIEWLDRQASITRATEQHEWIAQANGLIHEAQSEAKRLQAELDKRDQGIARLKKRRDELTAEVQHLRELLDGGQADELSELRDENAYLHEMLANIRRMTNGATNGA